MKKTAYNSFKVRLYIFSLLLTLTILISGYSLAAENGDLLDSTETTMSLDERIKQLESKVQFTPRSAPAVDGVASINPVADVNTLENEMQNLKDEIIELNKELVILEQDILTPVSSQTVLFLSIDKGHFFKLDGLKVQVDGKIVEHHLYTKQEIDALIKGAVQKVHTINLAPGNHEVVVFLSGFSIDGRDVKQAASYTFYKPNSKKYIELAIRDNTEKQKVDFEFSEWQ